MTTNDSAASCPAAGEVPKPCLENPVAMVRPGIFATGPITGFKSGVTSMVPAQGWAIWAFSKIGHAALRLFIASLLSRWLAAGSHEFIAQNTIPSPHPTGGKSGGHPY